VHVVSRLAPIRRARVALAVALLLASLVLGGCQLQTIGAPTGPLSLRATFDDAQGLVVGNNVQINNVVVGSVRRIRLRNYRAEVTISISDAHPIPADAVATIRQSTLLGEYFVDIGFPAGQTSGPFLHRGDAFRETETTPPVESVVSRAGQLLQAVSANDIGGIVNAGAEALNGRGPQLHRLIGQLSDLAGLLGNQSPQIGQAIDNLGQLGASLAPLRDQLSTLLDNVSRTTTMLTADRQRFFTTLTEFNKLLVSTNTNVIQPHAQQLSSLIREANGILASLNQNSSIITAAVDHFAMAVPRLTRVVSKGQLLMAEWVHVSTTTLGSGTLPPVIQGLIP
jgi:phospholipid/cholesterol/gamma-HCH transport system substrate-binding protein